MPRRGENIRKRKDGRWEARYKKGISETGRIIYGSVYAKTYKEARDKKQEMLRIVSTERKPFAQSPPLREILPIWFDDNSIRLKGATRYRYHSLVKAHILPDLGDMRLDQLTGPVINTYLADKLTHGRIDGKGGLSASYVRSIMLVIQSVLAFASAQSLCQPIQTKIHKPAVSNTELSILNLEEQRKLETYCLSHTDGTNAGVLLSLYAGLRIGEVCALRWDDIDFAKQIIHVRHTVARVRSDDPQSGRRTMLIMDRPKTASSLRDIPLTSWLSTYLAELKKREVSPHVVSEVPSFVSPRTYQYRYYRILRICNVSRIRYHGLRHTFATRCIEAGVDVKSLSEILGHADVSVTLNTYVHSSMEQKRVQLEKLTQLRD